MKPFYSVLLWICSLSVFAQSNDKTIMTIGKEEIKLNDFKYVYEKNNNNKSELYTKKSLNDYLNLYSIFRMKVQEAKEMRLDTIKSLMDEYEMYRGQLAQSYLSEKDLKDNLVQETYNRMKEEIRASHILVKLLGNASPADTLEAYNKISDIKKRVEKGEDFGDLALKLSDDPSAKDNKGDLGYFTALQMVYPFETTAYNTPIGKVSNVVRTKFGYHILKVTDRRPEQGEVLVKHLFLRTGQNASKEKEAAQKRKIDSLYQYVTKNQDKFDEVLRSNTDDKNSLLEEGKLAWFGSGRMVPDFEKAAFALKKNEISQPVKTNYGYHIIKLIDKRNLLPYDKMKDELTYKIKKDSRSNLSQQMFLNRMKKEYGYKPNNTAISTAKNMVDTNVYKNDWKATTVKTTNAKLFSLPNKDITDKDYFEYIEKTKSFLNGVKNPKDLANAAFDRLVESEYTKYEESQLPRKYPEYKMLSSEYLDGILLFDLTDKMVWSKASRDTSGLKEFYKKNKNKYLWQERADVVMFTAQKKEISTQAFEMYKKGMAIQAIRDTMKVRKQYISIEENKYERGQNDIVGSDNFKKGYESQPQTLKNNMYATYIIRDMVPPAVKELDEARGFIIADYQNELEQKWIQALKEKYKVTTNQKVVDSLYKK